MRILKKIILSVFIIHICWFLYFVFTNLSDAVDIKQIQNKLLLLLGGVVTIIIAYFIWLKKIAFVNKALHIIWKIIFTGYAIFFFYFLLGFIFNPPITFTQLSSLLTGNGLSRDYVSYNAMGPNIKLAVIASEDQLFPYHDGFDIKEIKMDIKYNKKHPNKIRGASTISQQTAKNIFLWQGRNFLRKGLETFFTFTIETGYSKRKILERYLNIAEMGPGIFGVQAAAKKYFNKDAKDLTRAEAAQIAACLPSPKKYTVKPLSNYVTNRYNFILQQMNNLDGDSDIEEIIK